MPHLDHETLLNYLEGRLTEAEQGRAAAHLGEPCRQCQARLRLLKTAIETAAADRTVAPPAAALRRALKIPAAATPPTPAGARTRLVAALGFDSRRQPSAAMARGAAHGRQLLFTADQVDIDLQIKARGTQHDVLGQVLDARGPEKMGRVFVSLQGGAGELVSISETDPHGQFSFKEIPPGVYDLVFDLEDREVAVIGLEFEND